jgi:rod shape-determining protein MreC
MRNLFAFVYRFRGFLVFLILELICAYLVVRNNSYQGAAFYNSANAYAGRVLEFQREISDYFRLIEVNRALVNENRQLREAFTNLVLSGQLDSIPAAPDSTFRITLPSRVLGDSGAVAPVTQVALPAAPQVFRFIPGKVINNSIRRINNYLTLDIGEADGVEPGMAVVSSAGVIGRVKATSRNYATVTSVLHSQMLVSAKIRSNNTNGTIIWEGDNYREATLNYIPRHIKLIRGDTVVTSGYNAVFPEGIMIGRVRSFKQEADKMFLTVRVQLAVDFDNLSYVYVLKNTRRTERDSLELKSGIKENE